MEAPSPNSLKLAGVLFKLMAEYKQINVADELVLMFDHKTFDYLYKKDNVQGSIPFHDFAKREWFEMEFLPHVAFDLLQDDDAKEVYAFDIHAEPSWKPIGRIVGVSFRPLAIGDEDIENEHDEVSDPLFPTDKLTVSCSTLYDPEENQRLRGCTKYAMLQLSGTCHAYAPLNFFLLCEPLRNYGVRVMHGILRNRSDITKTISTQYAKESMTQITASSIYRRVCTSDAEHDLHCPSTAGVCFTSFLLGRLMHDQGGFSLVNLVMMMSSLGLQGVINATVQVPPDAQYILLDSYVNDTENFTLVGGIHSSIVFKDSLHDKFSHVIVSSLCKVEDGSIKKIVFDSNTGATEIDWTKERRLKRWFRSRQYGFDKLSSYFVYLRNDFIAAQERRAICSDLSDFVDAESLLSAFEVRRLRRTKDYETVNQELTELKNRYTAPLYRNVITPAGMAVNQLPITIATLGVTNPLLKFVEADSGLLYITKGDEGNYITDFTLGDYTLYVDAESTEKAIDELRRISTLLVNHVTNAISVYTYEDPNWKFIGTIPMMGPGAQTFVPIETEQSILDLVSSDDESEERPRVRQRVEEWSDWHKA